MKGPTLQNIYLSKSVNVTKMAAINDTHTYTHV